MSRRISNNASEQKVLHTVQTYNDKVVNTFLLQNFNPTQIGQMIRDLARIPTNAPGFRSTPLDRFEQRGTRVFNGESLRMNELLSLQNGLIGSHQERLFDQSRITVRLAIDPGNPKLILASIVSNGHSDNFSNAMNNFVKSLQRKKYFQTDYKFINEVQINDMLRDPNNWAHDHGILDNMKNELNNITLASETINKLTSKKS